MYELLKDLLRHCDGGTLTKISNHDVCKVVLTTELGDIKAIGKDADEAALGMIKNLFAIGMMNYEYKYKWTEELKGNLDRLYLEETSKIDTSFIKSMAKLQLSNISITESQVSKIKSLINTLNQ